MRTGIVRIIGGATLSVLMASYMPLYAYADTYDISEGSITVSRDEIAQTVTQAGNYAVQDKEDNDPVITSNNQEVSRVTLTIEASSGQEAEVTIQDLNINDSSNFTPAILTTGEGNVKINLDGVNVVKSGDFCAGLQKENEGDLIITDNNATGSLDATGGDFGAGIGGGSFGNGTDITIEGGEVTATGGECGAGIGGGNEGVGSEITISNDAHLMVSGGIYDQYCGAAIGEGRQVDYGDVTLTSSGREISPDISLLTTDGYIKYYPAGTTANQIKNGSVQPTKILKSIITSSEALIDEGNTPQDEYAASEVISTTHSPSGGSYVDNSEVDSIPTSSEEFAAFLAATNNTLEVYIKKIEAMMAAGDTEGLNALVSKGITLETGNWVCFNKKTYALIEKISDLGVPVTISFAYKGRRYSTVIPGKADIRPLDLCNEEGYCGFLNLIKYYGGGEK